MEVKTIGNYKIGDLIGVGSFGKVYKGYNVNNGQVALKCITKNKKTIKQIKNLKLQTQILTSLKHENIINLLECIETDHEIWVVMDYAGNDLSSVIAKRHKKQLSEDEVRGIGKQILSAMLYLHENKTLHRDLKPQNILLNKNTIKICDFGFAKKMSASTNFFFSIKGTPLYIAPQILSEKPYTHKVDVWSFGIILYELFTGFHPFYAETIQKLKPKILNDKVKIPQNMQGELKILIQGMLQKNPHKRFDWNEVKNHSFFSEKLPSKVLCENQINLGEKRDQKQRKEKEQKIEKINIQDEITSLLKIDDDFRSKKLDGKQLKTNLTFYLSAIQILGQYCIDKTNVPVEIVAKIIKIFSDLIRSVKLAPQKQEDDITKNHKLLTAVIEIATNQHDMEFLHNQILLVGYFLKNTYNQIKMDLENQEQICNLVINLIKKQNISQPCINTALKIMGILASQGIAAIDQSEQFFERIAEDKVLVEICSVYKPIPQHSIILECIEKYIHPSVQKTPTLSTKCQAIFKELKKQVATALYPRHLIPKQKSLLRMYSKNDEISLKDRVPEVQIHLNVLLECLEHSKQLRQQFLQQSYWQELVANNHSRVYYLAFNYILSRFESNHLLTKEIIQNKITKTDDIEHTKLINVYLTYFMVNHNLKSKNLSKNKVEYMKMIIQQIKDLLALEEPNKVLSCKHIIQNFTHQRQQYFDEILVCNLHDVLYNQLHAVIKSNISSIANYEDVIISSRSIVEFCLLHLKLNDVSFGHILQLLQMYSHYQPNQDNTINHLLNNKIYAYFINYIKKDSLDSHFNLHHLPLPHKYNSHKQSTTTQNSHNISYLVILSKMLEFFTNLTTANNEEKDLNNLIKLIDEHSFHKVMFCQEAVEDQQTLYYALVFFNKIYMKISSSHLEYVAIEAFPHICQTAFNQKAPSNGKVQSENAKNLVTAHQFDQKAQKNINKASQYVSKERLLTEAISLCSCFCRVKHQFYKYLSPKHLTLNIVEVCAKAMEERITKQRDKKIYNEEPELNSNSNGVMAEKIIYLIGNLSKHSTQFFKFFGKYNIIGLIYQCLENGLEMHHESEALPCEYCRILKNSVYAIGNISFYSEEFSQQISPIIKYFAEIFVGKAMSEDPSLFINAISTISNLLRHSNAYISIILENKITTSLFQILKKSKTQDQNATYILNLFKKAMKYPEFFKYHSKEELRSFYEGQNVIKADNQFMKKIKEILT